MTNFVDLVSGGILSGALVALLALGISLVYRTSGVLNLSQGALAAAGAYMCYSASRLMPMLLAVVVATLLTSAIGGLLGLLFATRLTEESGVVAMVATLAIGVIIAQLLLQVWGSTPIFFPNVIGLAPVGIGPVRLDRVNLWGFAGAAGLALSLSTLLRFTHTGLALRAVADSVQGAKLSGISAIRMRILSWAIASGLAAIAGFFIASAIGILTPDLFDLYLIAGLLAAVIGGIGSLWGSVTGAMIIWVGQSIFASYAPTVSLGAAVIPLNLFSNTFLFALLMAAILLTRRGLFGGREQRRV